MTKNKPADCPQRIWDRYCIYKRCAKDLNWKIKTLEEWLRT